MKNKNKKKSIFRYIVIAAVLIIPFMYSFFYLKAYWDPYGKGNMDNLPVAIVNNDSGERGKELVENLKEKKALKLNIVSEKEATDGLYNKDYYAIISIPEDFTESIESINTKNKKHPTITYSPNQKSNFLSSQIIDRVVSTVEENLNNTINSEIVGTLEESLNTVPESLNTISNGLGTMQNGIESLNNGSEKLENGSLELNTNYNKFNNGLNDIKNGANTLDQSMGMLNEGINTLSESKESINGLKQSLPTLVESVDTLTKGSNNYTEQFNTYVDGVNNTMDYTKLAAQYIVNNYNQNNLPKDELYYQSLYMITENQETTLTPTDTIKTSGGALKQGNQTINAGMNELNNKVCLLNASSSKLDDLTNGIDELQNGSNRIKEGTTTLFVGANTLYNNSLKIQSGIASIYDGNKTLNSGINTLNNSVANSKNELDENITTTKNDLKKTENLKEYSKNPVTIHTKEVNKVSSYGTAFSPLFISIALWIGCLMLYIVLYFDKEERFGVLGVNSKQYIKRTLSYHGLATAAGVLLGVLLQCLLDFNITNIALYYFLMILVANTFVAIMEFLITNFKDIGKFLALIILVLQLAASAGTFPIETVTKGFRWLNPILPMTYTINLFKEALVTIETGLLTHNLIIVGAIFIVMFIINIGLDIYRQKKEN